MKRSQGLGRLITPSLLAAVCLFGSLACNSTGNTPSGDAIPLWARQATRTINNGYIIFVESDDEVSQKLAQFRSESAALNDLANECSMIPKGARIEDHFDHRVAHLFQAYTKVAVELDLCEKSKRALTPEAIRHLANATMTEQVKKYQADIGQTPELLADAEENGSDDGQSKPKANGEASEAADDNSIAPVHAQGLAVRDDEHFYVIREQLYFSKQDVILSPQDAYPLPSAEYQKFSQAVPLQTQGLVGYEAAHPTLKTSPHAWSYYRHQVMRPRVSTTGKEVRPIGAKPTPAKPRVQGERLLKRHKTDLTVPATTPNP